MDKIFISYKRKDFDSDRVFGLKIRLKELGCDVWIDESKLFGGVNWENEIRNAIEASNNYIVCLSSNWNEDGFAQIELGLILEATENDSRKKALLCLMEPWELPKELSGMEPIKLYEKDGFSQLISSLEKSVGMKIDPLREFMFRMDGSSLVITVENSTYSSFGIQSKAISEVLNFFGAGERLNRSADLISAHLFADVLKLWQKISHNPYFDPSHDNWFRGGISPFREKLFLSYHDLIMAVHGLIRQKEFEKNEAALFGANDLAQAAFILFRRVMKVVPKSSEFAIHAAPAFYEQFWYLALNSILECLLLMNQQKIYPAEVDLLFKDVTANLRKLRTVSKNKETSKDPFLRALAVMDFIGVKARIVFPSDEFLINGQLLMEKYDPGRKGGFDLCLKVTGPYNKYVEFDSIFKDEKFEVDFVGGTTFELTRPFFMPEHNEKSSTTIDFVRYIDDEISLKFPESCSFCKYCFHAKLEKPERREQMESNLLSGITQTCPTCSSIRLDHKNEVYQMTKSPFELGEEYQPYGEHRSGGYRPAFLDINLYFSDSFLKFKRSWAKFNSGIAAVAQKHRVPLNELHNKCRINQVSGSYRFQTTEENASIRKELEEVFNEAFLS